MLIISREAPVKVGKHAWNVFPLEALGFLLGRVASQEVYAALPHSEYQPGKNREDFWMPVYQDIEKARAVGQLFELDVVGLYASMDFDSQDDVEIPPMFKNTGLELLLRYRTLCCPQCSGISYHSQNRWLIRGEDYLIPPGKRISISVNQKRILKAWHGIHGMVDHTNQPRHCG